MRPTPASKGREVGAFEAVIARALALAPGDRHRNAGELLAALDQAAGGGPAAPIVQAPRKRMTTTVTLGALVVLAVALAASLTWRARKVPVAARPTVFAPAAPVAPIAPTLAAPRVEPAAARAPASSLPVAPAPATAQPAEPPASGAARPGRRKKSVAPPASTSSPAAAPAKRVDLFDDTK